MISLKRSIGLLLMLLPLTALGQGGDSSAVALVPNGTNVTISSSAAFVWTNSPSQVYLTICNEAGSTVYGAESLTASNNVVSGGITNYYIYNVGSNLTYANAHFFLTPGGACYNSSDGSGLWRGTVSLITSNGTAKVFIMGGSRK